MTMNGLHSNDDLHEEAAGNGVDDRLNELPDDMLLNIFDRVCALDAVRTCLLSKRTLHLPAMLSRIAIDVYSLLPAVAEDDDLNNLIRTKLARTNGSVARATRKILDERAPNMPIRKLKLKFLLRLDDCLSMGTSVARAMATNGVDAAEFKIITEDFDACVDAYLVGYAKRFSTFLRACPEAFAGLTRLHLENLRFRDPGAIEGVLATCERLESLRLYGCDGGVGSLLQLEHGRLVELEIFSGKFGIVEILWLPKLRRMVYDNWAFDKDPLFFGHVPQLSMLSLTNTCLSNETIKLSQMLANVTSISDMHLDFQSEMIWVRPQSPGLLSQVLSKLRRLNLDFLPKGCDIAWTLFFLEGVPSLEEMCLSVRDHWCGAETQDAHCEERGVQWEPSLGADFKHENLARLTIYGFQSTDNFIRYVKRVMSVAVKIQEISLHDTKLCELCTEEFGLNVKDSSSTYPRTRKESDLLRERIKEGLSTASPAVIHFN